MAFSERCPVYIQSLCSRECQFKRFLSIDFLLLLRGEIIIYFWNANKFDLSYRQTVKILKNPSNI